MIRPGEVVELYHFSEFDVLGLVDDDEAPPYQVLHERLAGLQDDLDRLPALFEGQALPDF